MDRLVVAGRAVGSVRLNFAASTRATVREIAWEWIVFAAATAMVVALAASVFVSRRITSPLVRLATTARAISTGDRSVRARVHAPGELGELANSFDSMAEQVSRSEQGRRNLTADVAHELRVDTDLVEGVLVHGDADRLHKALGNLVGNAARYTRPGDQVTVCVRRADGWAVVEVSDTGPGIPTEDLPHVFDRLWRGRTAATVSGSGIGLAVARQLITAHGGTITVRPTPDTETTFTVRLPALPSSSVAEGGKRGA